MKIKKYSFLMVFTILMLMIGVKGVFAESSKKCYYMAENNEFKATLRLSWGIWMCNLSWAKCICQSNCK